MASPRLTIGGYALLGGAGSPAEDQLYDELRANPLVGGLELPWTGESDSLHARGDEWLAGHLAADWSVVVTSIPGTMAALSRDATYGLASSNADGRTSALAGAENLRRGIHHLNQAAGRRVVSHVELHGAPRAGAARPGPPGVQAPPSSPASLERSLAEIAGWDWDGVDLLLEHVDARMPGHTPAKGFLRLDDEIAVIERGQLPVGILLNWGRSAIELRDPDAVAAQVERVRDAGLLRGLMFSGASAGASGTQATAAAGSWGEAWADQHLPPASAGRASAGGAQDGGSLLTTERMTEALAVAGDLDVLGLKIGTREPNQQATLEMVRQAIETVVSSRGVYR